ncbi:MAG TPA: hypothetical protein PLT45_09970 [Smithella sp.]|nr:hypothetical protein [Smithella sp.]
MEKVFTKRNLLFGFLLVALVIAFEVIFFSLSLPAWPAFMVMIFFFVAHEDPRQAAPIVVGGLMGIFCIVLLEGFVEILQPLLGQPAAKFFFIGLFVYSIVLLKDALPYLFNSYAFMFFLVAALAKPGAGVSPWVWMSIELVVGVIFILGILGINRAVDALLKKDESGARR